MWRLLCAGRPHLSHAGEAPYCSPAAETPIEEFTPTPAFPALQYLESVDVEGVAWRAGLRTGDFLIEVSPSHGPHSQVLAPTSGGTCLVPTQLPICPR